MRTLAGAAPNRLQRLAVPALVALAQIGGTIGAAQDQPERKSLDVLAVVLLLTGPVALAALRRRPVELTVTTMVAAIAYYVAGYPYGPIFISLAVALYWLIGSGRRRAGWTIAGAGFVALLALQAWIGRGPAWSIAHAGAVAGWLVAVLVVADIARIQAERVAEAKRAREDDERRRAGEERLRIAQELHDVLAHNISLISVQAGVGLHLMGDQPDKAREALLAIREASKDALGELRSVLDLLRRPEDAAPRSPTAGLDQLARVVANAAAAGLDVHVETEGAARDLPPEVDLAALRITQEALTNVARHAGASRARVRLRYEPDELLVEVDDDGRGSANGGPPTAGKGITGMQERAAALGGRLDAGPGPDGGFRVSAHLPLTSVGPPIPGATS